MDFCFLFQKVYEFFGSELPLGFRLTNYHSTENFGWKFMGGGVARSGFSCREAEGFISSFLPEYSRFTKNFSGIFFSFLACCAVPRGKIKKPLFVWLA